MPSKGKNFHVGLKAFLQKDSSFLALKDAYSDYWDVPGGRIEASEIDQPVTECLRRELLEELGLSFHFKINNLFEVCKFRVDVKNKLSPGVNLFLVFYACQYLGGDIVLNDESLKYEWLTKENYKLYNFGSQQKVIEQFVRQRLS
ncbi:MAG: NUDIX hydrolase [Patescibacteria group bacterium]|nr:NUDIX hydrolase [Patescibacteria group bacterium]